MEQDKTVETALERAEEILEKNEGKLGILGAENAYQQVWARDVAVTGLGMLLSRRPRAAEVFGRSLETLRRHQSPLGSIPHCVGYPNLNDPSLVALRQLQGYPATLGPNSPRRHGDTENERLVGSVGKIEDHSNHRSCQGTLSRGDGMDESEVDTAHSGCVDSSLWYILGRYYQYRRTQDLATLQRCREDIDRAFLWLQYQDSNECGLIEVHEAMDWADLFANRYNVLYDNVLYYACARAMGHIYAALGEDGSVYHGMAEDIAFKLNLLLWVGPEQERDLNWIFQNRKEWLYPVRLTDVVLVLRPYYLPYMAFRDYVDRCDVLGNLLAILFGVADEAKTERILEYIEQTGLNSPYPVRVLHPVINPGEKDWREYYRLRNLNQPYQFHNGGIWPFVGGFYVAALVKAGHLREARMQLARLAELNRLGRHSEWEFNEWFHGQSGRPMGFAHQSWSAGMYVYAYHCVESGSAVGFEDPTWAQVP